MRYFFYGLGILLFLLISFCLYFVFFPPLEYLRTHITQALSDASGYKVEIAGPFSAKFFPQTHLNLQQVSFTKNGSEAQIFVDKADVKFGFVNTLMMGLGYSKNYEFQKVRIPNIKLLIDDKKQYTDKVKLSDQSSFIIRRLDVGKVSLKSKEIGTLLINKLQGDINIGFVSNKIHSSTTLNADNLELIQKTQDGHLETVGIPKQVTASVEITLNELLENYLERLKEKKNTQETILESQSVIQTSNWSDDPIDFSILKSLDGRLIFSFGNADIYNHRMKAGQFDISFGKGDRTPLIDIKSKLKNYNGGKKLKAELQISEDPDSKCDFKFYAQNIGISETLSQLNVIHPFNGDISFHDLALGANCKSMRSIMGSLSGKINATVRHSEVTIRKVSQAFLNSYDLSKELKFQETMVKLRVKDGIIEIQKFNAKEENIPAAFSMKRHGNILNLISQMMDVELHWNKSGTEERWSSSFYGPIEKPKFTIPENSFHDAIFASEMIQRAKVKNEYNERTETLLYEICKNKPDLKPDVRKVICKQQDQQ